MLEIISPLIRYWGLKLLLLLAIVLVVAAIYREGYKHAQQEGELALRTAVGEQQKKDNAAMVQALNDQHANDQAAFADAQTHQQHGQAIQTKYQTITQTVTKYVESHPDNPLCVLPDDGLRIWNDSNDAATEAAASGG